MCRQGRKYVGGEPRIAVRFYERPSESMYMIGVTGHEGEDHDDHVNLSDLDGG